MLSALLCEEAARLCQIDGLNEIPVFRIFRRREGSVVCLLSQVADVGFQFESTRSSSRAEAIFGVNASVSGSNKRSRHFMVAMAEL